MATKLHAFNYMIVTYGYYNIQSRDKDHLTQHEMVIPIIYKWLKNAKIYAIFDHPQTNARNRQKH